MLVIPGYQVGNLCSGGLCIRFYARPVPDTVMFTRAPAETKDVVDRLRPWSGECGDTNEEMTELMRTGGEMTEKLARNRGCSSGCGRPGAVKRRQQDTRQTDTECRTGMSERSANDNNGGWDRRSAKCDGQNSV